MTLRAEFYYDANVSGAELVFELGDGPRYRGIYLVPGYRDDTNKEFWRNISSVRCVTDGQAGLVYGFTGSHFDGSYYNLTAGPQRVAWDDWVGAAFNDQFESLLLVHHDDHALELDPNGLLPNLIDASLNAQLKGQGVTLNRPSWLSVSMFPYFDVSRVFLTVGVSLELEPIWEDWYHVLFYWHLIPQLQDGRITFEYEASTFLVDDGLAHDGIVNNLIKPLEAGGPNLAAQVSQLFGRTDYTSVYLLPGGLPNKDTGVGTGTTVETCTIVTSYRAEP